ncbi:MAG TPA: DUF1206 domain-containing protein [Streptosporangiaceae bacterium]|nr:DUF1206 domain-containing protein [Streptosporangiaceae bacterium]
MGRQPRQLTRPAANVVVWERLSGRPRGSSGPAARGRLPQRSCSHGGHDGRTVGAQTAGQRQLSRTAGGRQPSHVRTCQSCAYGAPGPGGHKAGQRLINLGKALIYGFVTWGILKFALGLGAPAATNKQSRDLTSTAFKYSGGRFAVAIADAVIAGIGIYLAYQAYRARFLRDLRMGSASRRTREVVTWFGKAGGIARGAVFVTVGVFLIVAAIEARPGQAKGIDSALVTLARTPLGPWLLGAVALGLVLFGVYSCCEARWRQV